MEKVSIILNIFFILTTILTVWQFYRASNQSKKFLIIVIVWMIVQYELGKTDFYDNQTTLPPRFILLIFPPFLLIIIMFITLNGKKFIDRLSLKHLTLLHTIRIPVEIALYYLFIAKAIPQIMTFEGRNFDIIAGFTAPFIFYFGIIKNKISDKLLIVWNVLSLALLINIIIIALLSAKTPLQQFAFDQPNIALAHFPFNWLPSIIVPLVLFSHLTSLRQIIMSQKKKTAKVGDKVFL
ncbi:MAG: hypothetical protein EAZ13_00315 [Sphingobacteriia bacterium]|nr:MAG: hypothetical protein EAZ13_00315 [Sphingobacteriia bacterium]